MVQIQVRNALEPLSEDEVRQAVRILRAEGRVPELHRFIQVALHEPPKELILEPNGQGADREAFVVLMDLSERATYVGVVSLSAGTVTEWRHVPDAQPPITLEEFEGVEQACRESPEFQAAMRKRGITDMSQVMVDPWSAGWYEPMEGRRLSRALCWQRVADDDNGYARPIEGVLALVDLYDMQVWRVEDAGVTHVPQLAGNYTPKYVSDFRSDLKPIEITQPEGPSFEIDGYEVRWQKWHFRVGFTPREGLVLHTVGYEDAGRIRPVLFRASVAEMVVPYGDPGITHRRKNAFDVGEYNIGLLANSLELGCDCLGEIRYFDAVMSDNRGEPLAIKNAVCMHEEDAGMLWKHWDFRTNETVVRRSRKLVVSSISTVGNYDYGFFWSLYQDGSIEFEVKMTGIVSTGAVEPGTKPKFGELLNSDGLYAPIHQHFFNIRLDLDVDGGANSVYEVHAEAEPISENNPLGNAFRSVSTLLDTEQEAQQTIDPLRARVWKVVSTQARNAVDEPTAYRLVPHTNVLPFASPESSVIKRAAFMTKHLWVTPYARDERFPAGDYPNQHAGDDGLARWTSANRSIEDTDVVVWYTLGSHHVSRPEDWPVMPVQKVGFMLQPLGFFDRNPALDVPDPMTLHRNGHGGHCDH